MLRDGESSRIQQADHLINHLIDTQVGSIDNGRAASDRQRSGRSRGIDAVARGDFIVLPFGTPSLLADVYAGIDVKPERCVRKDKSDIPAPPEQSRREKPPESHPRREGVLADQLLRFGETPRRLQIPTRVGFSRRARRHPVPRRGPLDGAGPTR